MVFLHLLFYLMVLNLLIKFLLGKFRKVKCKCQHGLCTPIDLPAGANSCEVICGVNPCKQSGNDTVTDTCKYKQYKGDSYCDDGNNNAGCGWDGKTKF